MSARTIMLRRLGKMKRVRALSALLCILQLTAPMLPAKTAPKLEDFPLRVTVLDPGVLLTMSKFGCVWALDCATKGIGEIDGHAVTIACPVYACQQLQPGTYAARNVSGKIKWAGEQPVDEHMRSLVQQDIQILYRSSNGKLKVSEYWLIR